MTEAAETLHVDAERRAFEALADAMQKVMLVQSLEAALLFAHNLSEEYNSSISEWRKMPEISASQMRKLAALALIETISRSSFDLI
ncbi:MAG: hypothetical protein WC073_14825 [Sterolibacterium sp.]